MKLTTVLQKTGYWIVWATIFILPWFFLPITSEFYDFNKNFLLIASSLSLILIWATINIVDRQVRIVRSPLGLPILLVVVAWMASAILRSPNRVEAFLAPGQAGTWIALGLFFFTGVSFVRHKKEVDWLIVAVASSLGVLGLVTILFSSGAMSQLVPHLPSFMNSRLWSPTGSLLAAAVALVSAIPMLIYLVIKLKNQIASGLAAFSLLLLFISGGTATYRLLNPATAAEKAVFLDHKTGWGIALEALKASPILGTGPATFLSDFTRFRPVMFNLTPNWALRFVTSSNYYLELLATLGVVGLAAYLLLVFKSWKLVQKSARLSSVLAIASGLSLLTCFGLQLFLPINFVLLFLTFVYLVILVAAVKQAGTATVHEANVDIVAAGSTGNSPILPWVVLVLALLLGGSALYLGGRAYLAEVKYQQAIMAAQRNDGKTTYNNLASAISQNPFLDTYRVTFARTSLLLANSIASGQNLSDQDRSTVTQLAQQSIQEAKNAVALDPIKVSNVENLANIYRNLLNFAQGADSWTVASYRQAINLDPVNPNLRIALGGVLYAQKNYDDAIRFFQAAVDLKPDLANAHYNLAASYKQKGNLDLAITEMQAVVQLVDRNTSDYDKASKELADLQKQAGPAAKNANTSNSTGSQLTAPEPLPTPAINPPLKLDQSLSPETTPSPSTQTTPQ